MTFGIVTFRLMALSIMTLNIMTLCIMTFDIMAFGIMTLSIMTLGNHQQCFNAECRVFVMLSVAVLCIVLLNIVIHSFNMQSVIML
jgi:hypothetical protein